MTSEDFTSEQYDRAYQSAKDLRTLFETPSDSYIETSDGPVFISYERWMQMLFSFAPDGIYEVLGTMWDGEERPYVPAYLLSIEEIQKLREDGHKKQNPLYFNKAAVLEEGQTLPPLRKLRSYNNLVHYAMERYAGIAILGERNLRKRPDGPISLGEVASYYTFGNHGGSVVMQDLYESALKIDSNNPFQATVSDQNFPMLFDLEENDMIPTIILEEMDSIIRNYFPAANPVYKLLSQSAYAMKYSLCIILDIPKDDQQQLLKKISWMMPHYITVCFAENESFIL